MLPNASGTDTSSTQGEMITVRLVTLQSSRTISVRDNTTLEEICRSVVGRRVLCCSSCRFFWYHTGIATLGHLVLCL